MQVTIKQYSEIITDEDFRIDAEYHRELFKQNPLYKYVPIREALEYVQYGISIDMNEEGRGIKIYRMNEIHDMFCDAEISKCADIELNEAKNFFLKPDDVLFNRTNSFEWVGRTGIYKPFCQENRVFASYLIRIRTNKNIVLPEYLTTFLNTKFGIFEIKRRARISINQSNVNAQELQNIKIPLISNDIQEIIKKIFNISHNNIFESKQNYQQAEEILLNELSLSNWQPKHKLWTVEKFSETKATQRIDAEYYQSKYYEIINSIKKYSNGWNYLEKLVNVKDKNYNPVNEKTYKYLELSNISNSGEITGYTEEKGKDLPTRARRIVKSNDVIISSIEGSLESIALVTEQYNDALCSNGFYVVNSDFYNSETLLCLMKSCIGQQQLKKGCNGTILTAINKDEFSKIVLPKVKDEIQKEIKNKISESYKLKYQSKQLLEIAKRSVEIAIEESEEIAITWINQELKKIGVSL